MTVNLQLISVKSKNQYSPQCSLEFSSRKNEKSEWQVEFSCNALGGKDGFISTKIEGDHKTPIGEFSLTKVFGYSEIPDWLKMPYMQCTSNLFCVDDVNSKSYNRIVIETNDTIKDWNSAEVMLRSDRQYEWGLVIDFNCGNPVPSLGSCIFIHVKNEEGTGTEGCIALERRDLLRVLRLIDYKKNPLIRII